MCVMFLGKLSKKIILPETFIRVMAVRIRKRGYYMILIQCLQRLRLRNKWLSGSC